MLYPRIHFPAPVASTGRPAVRRRFTRAALALLMAVPSVLALGSEAPLSLENAQRRAVAHSRLLAAKHAEADAALEQAGAARALPDPILSAGVDGVPISGPDRFSLSRDFMTQRQLGLTQELTRGAKRRLRAERFEREAAKAGAEQQSLIADIRRDTAIAWLDRYYAEAALELIRAQAEEAGLDVAGAEAGYRGGRGSQAEVLAARGALAAIRERAIEAEARLEGAKLRLARWTGGQPGQPLAGRPGLGAPAFDPAGLEHPSSAYAAHRVLARGRELAAAEVALARADAQPDWSIEVTYRQRGSSYSDMVSVGLSVPLRWDRRNRQDRDIAAKVANLERVRAESEEALRQFAVDTRLMLAEWKGKRERLEAYAAEILPLAQARKGASLAAYRGGKASLSEVLSARRDELGLRLQALELEAETARVAARLHALMPQAQAGDLASAGADGVAQ